MNSNIITSEDMKQKFIKHLQEDIYCRIGVSSIHGIGVIAIKDIPKGTYPFKKLSDDANEKIIILDDNDLKNVNKNVVKIVGDFFDGTGHGTYPILYNGPNNLSISYYLNHSDNPNMDPVYNQEMSNRVRQEEFGGKMQFSIAYIITIAIQFLTLNICFRPILNRPCFISKI